jgi:hypothetical protein
MWSPTDESTSLCIGVRLIRDVDQHGPHLVAVTEDDVSRGAEPSWIYRDGVWRWRGLGGYRSRPGTVTVTEIPDRAAG